jgi:hypothetical protein
MSFKLSHHVNQGIRDTVFKRVDSCHAVSHPVIRKVGDDYYLAVFVTRFTRDELMGDKVHRPDIWVIADLETGKVLKIVHCADEDFSDVPADEVLHLEDWPVRSEGDYERLFARLDEVREKLLTDKKMDGAAYKQYMEALLASVPETLRRFYRSLSSTDA